MAIRVYQGEHSLCRDNRLIGELVVDGLVPSTTGLPHDLAIRFTYDLSGLLEVEATLPEIGRKESVVLQETAERLSPEQVEKARASMARLKFHPREALPNTAALARAEALHVELRGLERERLAAAMSDLRLSIESQDDHMIRPAREVLLALVDAYRPRGA